MWHVTFDTWHVTCDMWHVSRLGGWTFSQNFSSLALTICDLSYYEDILGKGWLNEIMNEWISSEAVCRTAPSTPGLSKKYRFEIAPWNISLFADTLNLKKDRFNRQKITHFLWSTSFGSCIVCVEKIVLKLGWPLPLC